MIDIAIDTIYAAADSAGSTGGLVSETAINSILDYALAEIRKAVAEEIPRFDVGAIQVHAAGPDMYFISVLSSAIHRESLYSNYMIHGSKYAEGLRDIIALKHFGTGHESEIPLHRKKGYWVSQGVWTLPMSTVGSYFLYDVIKLINAKIRELGLPAIATVGDNYT